MIGERAHWCQGVEAVKCIGTEPRKVAHLIHRLPPARIWPSRDFQLPDFSVEVSSLDTKGTCRFPHPTAVALDDRGNTFAFEPRFGFAERDSRLEARRDTIEVRPLE